MLSPLETAGGSRGSASVTASLTSEWPQRSRGRAGFEIGRLPACHVLLLRNARFRLRVMWRNAWDPRLRTQTLAPLNPGASTERGEEGASLALACDVSARAAEVAGIERRGVARALRAVNVKKMNKKCEV